jgi:hypothetical protein
MKLTKVVDNQKSMTNEKCENLVETQWIQMAKMEMLMIESISAGRYYPAAVTDEQIEACDEITEAIRTVLAEQPLSRKVRNGCGDISHSSTQVVT